MIKRILPTTVVLLLIAYLVAAVTVFDSEPAHQVCHDMELVIKDTLNAGFVTKDEVVAILQKKGIYPVGKKMDRIHTKTLEKELNKHPLINEAQCYKTPSGKLCVEVIQRVPILRTMGNNGENYYLDNKGKVMPPDAECVAHRATVTGNVEKSFAIEDLHKFGIFLQDNPFWEVQIVQINVLPGKEIELIPCVGSRVVYLSKLEHFEDKLGRSRTFYEKGLNQVGWNKYSRISLEFGNQIICTKKKQ